MKRRRFLQALAASPAVPPLLAQQAPQPQGAAPALPPGGPSPFGATPEVPAIKSISPDAAAEGVPHFFPAPQFEVLRKLSDLLMPPANGSPGALAAGAPEFLDFLIGVSPASRQQLYSDGLQLLDARAREKFSRDFASLDAAQAAEILRPLEEPWTYDPPSDPLARFLREAHADIRRATANSRQSLAHTSPSAGRRPGGIGLYWFPIDPIV